MEPFRRVLNPGGSVLSRRRVRNAEVAEHRPGVEAVVLARDGADVVERQREAARAAHVAHDADVIGGARGAGAETPDDDVAGLPGRERGAVERGGKRCGVRAQVDEHRGDAAVIDVAVGMRHGREGCRAAEDVVVDELLEVDARRAEGADDDVRADAAVRWRIAVGVGERGIGGVVRDGAGDLEAGAGDDGGGAREREIGHGHGHGHVGERGWGRGQGWGRGSGAREEEEKERAKKGGHEGTSVGRDDS